MIPIIVSSAAPYVPVPAKAIGWPDFSRNSKCFSPPTVAGGAAPEKKNTASNPINPYLPNRPTNIFSFSINQNGFKTGRFCSRVRREEEKKRSVRSVHLVRKRISRTNNAAIGQKMVVLKPFYQPASFLRDFKVNTIQAFSVAFTFSPVTALAANEGTLSW